MMKAYNRLSDKEVMVKAAKVTTISFLLIHVAYFTIFLIIGAYFLVYFNIFSVLFYALMYLLIIKGRLLTFSYLTLIEIPIHMMAGSICLGFDCGFQLCIIGLPTMVCIAGYFSRKVSSGFKVIPSCLFLVVSYFIIYFYTRYHDPYYDIADYWEITLFVIHAFITFAFIIVFLYGIVLYAYSLEKRILKDSRTDKLTQIPNRKALEEFYEKIKDNRNDYVLAIYDIDDFKKFNDVNGHLCGDYVLKEIAQLSKDKLYGDFICRWGGEEFVVLSRVDSSYDDTINKLDSIRSGIELHNFKYYRKNLKSTITMGAQTYVDGMDLDEWIRSADAKLYEGKKNGKNQLVH
ncbi:MAG: GGDEF domain-containing protein [Acholeplasmatales bacterium]|nr:GGDEF domain-containing protein [Acholeplasmatales bacterium]